MSQAEPNDQADQPEKCNPVKSMLRTQMQKHQPTMYKQLQESGELEAYLQRRTDSWIEEEDLLMKQGLGRAEAREILWEDQLLPDEEDSKEKTVDWSQVDPVLWFNWMRDKQEKEAKNKG